MMAHQVDYRIYGEEMKCVEIELGPNETAIASAPKMGCKRVDEGNALADLGVLLDGENRF